MLDFFPNGLLILRISAILVMDFYSTSNWFWSNIFGQVCWWNGRFSIHETVFSTHICDHFFLIFMETLMTTKTIKIENMAASSLFSSLRSVISHLKPVTHAVWFATAGRFDINSYQVYEGCIQANNSHPCHQRNVYHDDAAPFWGVTGSCDENYWREMGSEGRGRL